MPQFDFTTYSQQIFWFSICFALLYLFMSSIILPRIRDIIKERKSTIDSNILELKILESKITETRASTEILRNKAIQQYKVQIENIAKSTSAQREKNLEETKIKIDQIAKISRKEIKDFILQSETKNKLVIENLIQSIEEKIFA